MTDEEIFAITWCYCRAMDYVSKHSPIKNFFTISTLDFHALIPYNTVMSLVVATAGLLSLCHKHGGRMTRVRLPNEILRYTLK